MPRLKTYEKLYIYTVHGKTPGAEKRFGASLLAAWEDSGTTLLFFEKPNEKKVLDYLAGCPDAKYLSENIVDYENWEAGKPVKATRVAGFLICPTWDVQEPERGEHRILLDPGVAFGSGQHVTTRNALRALKDIYRVAPPKRVLDLGCGTAILSIAAVMLGAERSTAVDYTSMATDTARVSLELNGMESRIRIINGDALENLHHKADLVLCNIYLQVIRKLFEAKEFTDRDWLVVSGIHGSRQHEAVTELIAGSGRKLIRTYAESNWYTYLTARG